MHEHLKDYKGELEHKIVAYMALPVSERSAAAITGMVDCWEHLEKMGKCLCHSGEFSTADAKDWAERMVNDDGTTGPHWTVAQTTPLAATVGLTLGTITECAWNVTMNMMYSDYCAVATKYNANKPEFYADMAKAFLCDKDAPSPTEKLAAYYHGIVDKD